MANPNIVNTTTINGNTAYMTPSGTSATTSWTYNGSTALTGLTPATGDRKSTRLNFSHIPLSRMPSSA